MPGNSREQIDPRRGRPGVTVHPGVPRAALWGDDGPGGRGLVPVSVGRAVGSAAAEAQACGTPVVAFRRGGLSEVIVLNVTGFLVPVMMSRLLPRRWHERPGSPAGGLPEHAQSLATGN